MDASTATSLAALLANILGAVDRAAFEQRQFSDFADLAKSALVGSFGTTLSERLSSRDLLPEKRTSWVGRITERIHLNIPIKCSTVVWSSWTCSLIWALRRIGLTFDDC